MQTPTLALLIKRPVHLLAFGFGAGLLPKAPGTAGTVLAVMVFPLLAQLALPAYVAVVALTAVVGIYLCGRAAKDLGVHDHPGIVWDEIVGFWLAMIAIPATWPWVLAAFVLFRVFDIYKPWPISWCDRHLQGGTGIMLDDLLAGAFTWLILFSVLSFF